MNYSLSRSRLFLAAIFLLASFLFLQACSSGEENSESENMNREEVMDENQQASENTDEEDETSDTDTQGTETEMDEGDQSESAELDFETAWALDSDASSLGWYATKVVGNDHSGEVMVEEGYMNEALDRGYFVIDMTSITESEDSQMVVDHLKSDDFFDVENYPTSVLEINSVEGNDDGTMAVSGDLTILGQTNPVNFDVNIDENEDQLTATAEFNIDRTLWGVNFDSNKFKELGDAAIKDEIEYSLDLVFERVE